MAIRDVRQLRKFTIKDLKVIMIKWRIVGRSKPKAKMIEAIRADENWSKIKESISVPEKKKRKVSKKQLEARKKFSEMVKKKNKGKVPRKKSMKSTSSFAGGNTPVVKKKSLMNQIKDVKVPKGDQNDKKKKLIGSNPSTFTPLHLPQPEVKEVKEVKEEVSKEKVKSILEKLFNQVNKSKEKLDIKRISLVNHFEDIKKIPKDEVFNDEFHANFKTEKGTKRAQFCGPGTKVGLRIIRGDRGITKTDKFCTEHDLDYRRASLTKGLRKEKRIDITQKSDAKLLENINGDDTDFFINKLKIKFAMNLKFWSESLGVISKDKYIGEDLDKKEITKFEYSASLVDFINNVEDGKLITKLLKKPKKVIREFLLDLHSKSITIKELEELLK